MASAWAVPPARTAQPSGACRGCAAGRDASGPAAVTDTTVAVTRTAAAAATQPWARRGRGEGAMSVTGKGSGRGGRRGGGGLWTRMRWPPGRRGEL